MKTFKSKKIEIKNFIYLFILTITMKFCQNCDNLLYLKINDKKQMNQISDEGSENVSETATGGDDMPNTDEPLN